MRLTIERGAYGYEYCRKLLDAGNTIDVFLDGFPMSNVRTADEDAGYIVRDVVDAAGNYAIENDEFVTETIYGKVRIEIRKPDGTLAITS